MPDPHAEIIADPPVRAAEWDLGRVLFRHRRCLAIAEYALAQAGSESAQQALADICTFHRRRVDVLACRFTKAVPDSSVEA